MDFEDIAGQLESLEEEIALSYMAGDDDDISHLLMEQDFLRTQMRMQQRYGVLSEAETDGEYQV